MVSSVWNRVSESKSWSSKVVSECILLDVDLSSDTCPFSVCTPVFSLLNAVFVDDLHFSKVVTLLMWASAVAAIQCSCFLCKFLYKYLLYHKECVTYCTSKLNFPKFPLNVCQNPLKPALFIKKSPPSLQEIKICQLHIRKTKEKLKS